MLRAIRVAGRVTVLTIVLAASFSAPAAAQAGGGFTFGNRNDLGPRYELYPERMWEIYKRTGTCPPVEVRTRLPNGRVVVRRVPWNPQACRN
jgi:hypothetical protein